MLHFPPDITLQYYLLTLLLSLGTLQMVATGSGLHGLLLLRPRQVGFASGLVTVVSDLLWFFLSEDRNRPGLAGWELFMLFGLGAASALVLTLIVCSLTWRSAEPSRPAPEGLEALRDRSYWQVIAPRMAERRWGPGT